MNVKITRIQKTKKGRFSLFCENGFLFSVDDETLVKNHIIEGIELSDFDLDCLLSQSDLRKAKEKALSYISLRDYSRKELLDKLKLKFDEDTALAAVESAQNLGLINDDDFAVHRAKYLNSKNKSTREISAALSLKGISREAISAAIDLLETGDEEACRMVIEKNYLTKLNSGKKDNVIAALARKGFSYSVIKQALSSFKIDDEQLEYGDYE